MKKILVLEDDLDTSYSMKKGFFTIFSSVECN